MSARPRAPTGAGSKLVTIVVNNCNYERFVGDAIASALDQSYPRVEVIVVDDGSTDGSRSVIAGFGHRVEPIFKPNGGQSSAFNEGFRRSRGEVVMFLDADDLLLPTAAETAVRLLSEAGTVKAHWPLWEIDQEGNRTDRLFPPEPLAEGDLSEVVRLRGPVSPGQPPTSGNAWSREFLEAVMPLPEHEDKHGADGFLRKLAPLYGVMRTSAEPLGCYRVHSRNYGGGRGALFMFQRALRRYPAYCKLLEEHLEKRGLAADVEGWLGPGSDYRWMRDAVTLHAEVTALVPEDRRLILIDGNHLGVDFLGGREVLPFTESEGAYWGPPRDDQHALDELDRLRALGAEVLVVAFTAFWWLDAYPAFSRRLRASFAELLRNERVIVYDICGSSCASSE